MKIKQMPAVQGGNIVGPCRHKLVEKRCLSCILDTSDYFAGLPAKAKLALQPAMAFGSFGRRQTLYAEGSPSTDLYILLSGEVKVYKSLSQGHQQIHKLVSVPGDLIGCEDLFLDTHCSTAECLDDVTVCYLRKQRLHEVSQSHGEVSETLMRSMARNLNSYVRHISNLGQKKALERVASYLVYLHQTHRERQLYSHLLAQSLTRTELADMLGITQRTLIRGLKTLEGRKLISLEKDGFFILNMPALMRLGEGR